MEKPILQYTEIADTKVSKYFKVGTILFFILLPFAFLVLVSWALSGISGDGSGEYNIISSTPSPDGKNIAIVYAGSGGGAAGWSFCHATIVAASEQFNPEQHNDYIFDIKGGRNVEAIWEGNDNLLITYTYKSGKDNPYFKVSRETYSRHTGINVRYIEKAE